MYSSDPKDPNARPPSEEGTRWGTIFMGPDESRESRMDKVLSQQESEQWNRSTEHEYMRRVRERATLRAQALIDKAQSNAAAIRSSTLEWAATAKLRSETALHDAERARAEAENLRAEADQVREQAAQEGYQAGVEAAQADLVAGADVRGAAAAAVIERMRAQCSTIFDAWRSELAALTCDAVAAATGWVLDTQRSAIMEQLLCDAARTLDGCQRVSLHVHPEDVPFFEDVLGTVGERLGMEVWSIQPDAEVESGGLRLESSLGRVEAYPSTRKAIVDEALSRLALPSTDVDAAAYEAVHAPCAELELLPPPLDLSQLMDGTSQESTEEGLGGTEDASTAGAEEVLAAMSEELLANMPGEMPGEMLESDLAEGLGTHSGDMPNTAPSQSLAGPTDPQTLSGLSDVLSLGLDDAMGMVPGVAPDLLSSLAPSSLADFAPGFDSEDFTKVPEPLAAADSVPDAPASLMAERLPQLIPQTTQPEQDWDEGEELADATGHEEKETQAPAIAMPAPVELSGQDAADALFRTLEADAAADIAVDAVIDLGPTPSAISELVSEASGEFSDEASADLAADLLAELAHKGSPHA